MAAINELISQIDNPELRDRIQKEVNKLSKQKKFGLVFEEHLPECTPLYDIPVRRGAKVALKSGKVNDFYTVLQLNGNTATCIKSGEKEPVDFDTEELVTIAEFGEPIYPYLKPIDTVCNAPDSDLWHTLIEADNYHALQLLEYLYAGKVDCIYIDPPYNTGAKDWKYNNDYVDGNDTYRHSKWLSMMQKRLKLAKKLLNPADSVLIVTIDEKEYLHLGCLLEEIFPNNDIQMISTVINPKGSARNGRFSRVDEYIFYVFIGTSGVIPGSSDMLRDSDKAEKREVRWAGLMRNGKSGVRTRIPSLFYPIFIDSETGEFHSVGSPLPRDADRNTVKCPHNTVALFPINSAGSEQQWSLYPPRFLEYFEKGYIKFGKRSSNGHRTIYYLQDGMIRKIKSGDIIVSGKNKDGSLELEYSDNIGTRKPATIWHQSAHSASEYGTTYLNGVIGPSKFTFPKSLYAVHDSINFVLKGKPNGIILDFFAGSGTTLHAVNLLNAEDDGHRRCILVTNNEVSEDEAKMLTKQGYHPGDPEWEKLGIAHYVTWPRTVCSIEGHDISGNPLKGNYLGSDLPMADGFKANAAFFKLDFLDKNAVALGRQFKEMLPTLWLKAGAYGPCPKMEHEKIAKFLIYPENHFAVLTEENAFSQMEQELEKYPEIETVYIVTDYEPGYCSMAKSLKVKHTYQLYRDYLDNFRLNTGRNRK